MNIRNLVEDLYQCKIKLEDVPIREVLRVVSNRKDQNEIKGMYAEVMVHQWLSRCEGVSFDDDLPRQVKEYHLEKEGMGIKVTTRKENGRTICEFDGLVYYQRTPIIVEVKSSRLNGFAGKIQNRFELGRDIYSRKDVSMLLFFPFSSNKNHQAMERIHPRLKCVNLGYKKRHLNDYVSNIT